MWLKKNINLKISIFTSPLRKNTKRIQEKSLLPSVITFFIRFHEKVLDEINIDLVSSDEKKEEEEEEPLKKNVARFYFRVDKLKWNRVTRKIFHDLRLNIERSKLFRSSTIDNYHRNWREYAKNGISRGFGRHYGGT